MRAALLLFEEATTPRKLARAISEFRARYDDGSEELEDIEFALLDASRHVESGQTRPETATPRTARHDERMLAVWLTYRQAADLIGVSPRTIRRWVKDGLIRSSGPGHSQRIHRDAIADLMEARDAA